LHDIPGQERSGLFLYLNTNKRGITLNLKSKAGIEIFKELVKNADVVVESFKPGKMASFGLDYESLSKINPKLVMTSISNFGQTGPYKDYKLNHLIAWGMSGARYTDGAPGERPVQPGGRLTHYIAGVHAVVGTTVALYQRNRNSYGQHVDVSIFESALLSACYPAVIYSYTGQVHNSVSLPYLGIFRCRDGYVGLNVYRPHHWQLLCAFFGLDWLVEDPRFQTLADIRELLQEVRTIFAPLVAERYKMELFQSANEWGIPVSLVPTTQEIIDSPQHKHRGFFVEVEHPVMGKIVMPGAPFKLTKTPYQLRRAAPLLGEHNEEIYCGELGYSKEILTVLREQEVI
jgi:crotonobetainyl-CoA:carnitine CoA-transferase CaiB-like acyl-CoA transferase